MDLYIVLIRIVMINTDLKLKETKEVIIELISTEMDKVINKVIIALSSPIVIDC